jgi:hypothetical protein
MKKEVVNEVYKTRDYEAFKLLPGNRTIDAGHIVKLKKSFAEKQLPIPIIVNSNMEILDGQHRWATCKEMNLDLYYIVIDNFSIKDVVNANTIVNKWGAQAYYDSYVAQGYEEYKKMNYFMEVTSCNLGDARLFLELSSEKDFKNGGLVCDTFDRAYMKYTWYQDFAKAECYGHRSFKAAIKKIFNIEEYDHERMMHQLNKGYWSELSLKANTVDYVSTLSKIYNIGKTRNNVLQFNVNRSGEISTYKMK